MPVNDFLPFATGAGANVENQSTYASSPSTLSGFSAGIAQSAKLNKVWRQSSFVSAAVAQLVVDQLGIDVLDNGDVPGFTANLEATIKKLFPREMLYAPRNYYVNPATGSDTNSGLTPTAPWQTLLKAADVIQDELDLNAQDIVVNMANGVYGPVWFNRPVVSQGLIMFRGNVANPAAVTINAVNQNCAYVVGGTNVWFEGMTFQATGLGDFGHGLYANSTSAILWSNVAFSTCQGNHLVCRSNAYLRAYGPYTINGGAQTHCAAVSSGIASFASAPTYPDATWPPFTVTLVGTPNFSNAFMACNLVGQFEGLYSFGVSWSGAATGVKFRVSQGGQLNTSGGGINYFPGSSPGIVDAATFGVYS